jgi:anaerobic selenocysteine-containing dehydrogenase
LSPSCDLAAAEAFFRRAINSTGCTPEHVVTDTATFYPSAIRTYAAGAKHTATGFYNLVISTNRCERNHGEVTRSSHARAEEFLLFSGGQFATDDGRARFHVPTWRQPTNSAPHLVTLITGRERDQWHTMTRTHHVPQLLKNCPTPYVAVHPSDAERLGLVEGDQAELRAVGAQRVAVCRPHYR